MLTRITTASALVKAPIMIARIRACRRDLGKCARFHLFRFVLRARLNVRYHQSNAHKKWDNAFIGPVPTVNLK
jgi:hypothetical protein